MLALSRRALFLIALQLPTPPQLVTAGEDLH
jgi:hypothetical protein